MAFNWQTFWTRTFTGAIFIVIMLAGILWNQWSFLILFSIIHFGCWWEYFKLIEKIHQTHFHTYVKLGFMVIGYGLMLWFCDRPYETHGYVLKDNLSLPVSGAGFAVLMIGIFQKTIIKLRSFAIAALGLLYISLSWGLMIDLYTRPIEVHVHDAMYVFRGDFMPVTIIVSIWANDTMAYLVGSMIGKTPLTKISPKKTWEGTIGGIILGIVITAFLIPWVAKLPSAFTFSFFIILVSGVAAVSGTFGDLLESKLKRMANVKDSGALMPGHGGFLDRFDSLLAATPAVWLVLYFFTR